MNAEKWIEKNTNIQTTFSFRGQQTFSPSAFDFQSNEKMSDLNFTEDEVFQIPFQLSDIKSKLYVCIKDIVFLGKIG